MKHSKLLLLLALTLVACERLEPSVLLPLQKPQPPGGELFFTASFHGVPIVERGCVRVKDAVDGVTRTVLWHGGTELGKDGTGYFLRSAETGRSYSFGSVVTFGGGEAEEKAIAREYPQVFKKCGPPFALGYLPMREPKARTQPPPIGLRPNNSFKPKPLRGSA